MEFTEGKYKRRDGKVVEIDYRHHGFFLHASQEPKGEQRWQVRRSYRDPLYHGDVAEAMDSDYNLIPDHDLIERITEAC